MAISVAGSINGRLVDMVVDMGAEKAFDHEDFLPICGIDRSGQQLCGVMWDFVPMRVASVGESDDGHCE